jgi:type II secretory pathway pseudopilin PulG
MKALLVSLVAFILGFLASTILHNLLAAGEASKNKRAAGDARSISAALEKYHQEHGSYPPVEGEVRSLQPFLAPRFLRSVPTSDAYGRPFLLIADSSGLAIASTGRNGFVVRKGVIVSSADRHLSESP